MSVRFDLLTLKLFIAVVEEQSIARAAERENIVPSAVSKRISDLEADLKVSLIQRHNRGIATTRPAMRCFATRAASCATSVSSKASWPSIQKACEAR